MKNGKLLSWLLLAASAALAIVSYLLLPETVVTQFSLGGGEVTTMPKLAAIALPLLLGAGGALLGLRGGANGQTTGKHWLISGVVILVFIIMLAVNRL